MKRIIILTTLALGLTLVPNTMYAGGNCANCVHPYSQANQAANQDRNAGITLRQGLALAVSYLLSFYGTVVASF